MWSFLALCSTASVVVVLVKVRNWHQQLSKIAVAALKRASNLFSSATLAIPELCEAIELSSGELPVLVKVKQLISKQQQHQSFATELCVSLSLSLSLS